ncbi:AtpZ/AtpI family protein [Jannaschia rubra]|uniref:Putative F0F1-ATPase subunit n=1 Tax=Jannaschia rubra TaxID=282197 RepID=A0A0M6XSU5_9RHOB|nr:AtpZ/AtpI family protein [Jannaschia rubra]CTQ33301.1 putative F0F1-ATPase subunit [Jannaschia rubra]SFF98764.1 ATP synthase protein I [Jannaschia rubra]
MKGRRDRHADRIGRDATRKQAARDDPGPSPLRGIGAFGVIGWSVAVPTVGGAFLGLWLDRTWPQAFQWTIAMILGGLVVGALIAWAWIDREGRG